MRLSGDDLSAARGGRRVFEGFSFSARRRRDACRDRAERRRQVDAARVWLPACSSSTAARSGSIRQPEEAAGGRRCTISAISTRLKPALTRRARISPSGAGCGAGPATSTRRSTRSASAPRSICRVASLSAGQKRRAALARLLVAPRPLWLLDEPDDGARRVRRGDARPAGRGHLAGGGMAMAATHRALPVAPTQTIATGTQRHDRAPSRRSPARPRACRSGAAAAPLIGLVFFLAVVTHRPVRRRARFEAAGPHRPGDPVDRRAARDAARARPALPGRPRRRLARPSHALRRAARDRRRSRSVVGHWLATGLPLVIAAPVLGLLLGIEPRRPRRRHADAPRRLAGADADRRDRRRPADRARPRRPAGRGPRPPLHHSGADLRGQRHGGGDAFRLFPAAIPDPDRDDPVRHGGRHHRRRRRAAGGLD